MKTQWGSRSRKLFTIVGGAVLIHPAFAQEQRNEELEEIVVTGLRGSLTASMETKREAIGVVDAINAEDIGKFPDTNLSESLQRITGISIDRRNGEGALVTARGFGAQYNMVTLNGRLMPAADAFANIAGTSRAFNFANLSSDSISAVEVYKTSKANIATGGIGATINIKTTRPLEEDGLVANFGVKAVHDTTNRTGDDITPELTGIFSYANDDRTWGVALTASHQRRDSGSSSATINDWRINRWDAEGTNEPMAPDGVVRNAPADGQLYGIPTDMRYHFSDRERERNNGQLTVQFAPTDALTLTTDYTYAENHLIERRGDQTIWFARTGFSDIEFDTNQAVATPVFIREPVGIGKDHGFEQQYREQTNELKSLGFNADWQVSEALNLALDVHDSTMESMPTAPSGGGEITFSMAGRIPATQTMYFNSGLPIATYTLNDSSGNGNGVFDEGDMGSQILRVFYQAQETDLTQARLDGDLEFAQGGRFQFGVETRALEMHQRGSTHLMKLGDWGVTRVGDIPADLYEAFCLACQFDDYNTNGIPTVGWKGDAVELARWGVAEYRRWNETNLDGQFVYNPDFQQNHSVEEDTQSAYFQLAFKGEFGSMPANFLAGVRYERTDVTATSFLLPPSQIRWSDNNDFFVDLSNQLTAYSVDADYDHVLPNLDVDVEIVTNVKARFSASKTIARAEYIQMRPAVTIGAPNGSTRNGAVPVAGAGNPGLVPLESDNLDLSLEWYFAEGSYVSGGFWEKRVSNFIGEEAVDQQHFGLRNPTAADSPRVQAAVAALQALGETVIDDTELFVMMAVLDNPEDFPNGAADYQPGDAFATQVAANYDIVANEDDPLYTFRTARPVNNREARIHGWEFGGQHFFGDSGFGIQANYTIVRGDVGFDNNADPALDQFALLGLSDSANAVLMYENFGLSVRLAYNWRDEFLQNSNFGAFRNPVYVEEFEQWDLSVGYDINDSLAVSFEGINLTEENVRWHGRSPLQMWFLEDLGARYQLGARYKF